MYIGEMSHNLKDRISDHMRCIKNGRPMDPCGSAIGFHSIEKHGEQPNFKDWGFKILDFALSTQHWKLLEAYYINKFKPNLNWDSGVRIIMHDLKF